MRTLVSFTLAAAVITALAPSAGAGPKLPPRYDDPDNPLDPNTPPPCEPTQPHRCTQEGYWNHPCHASVCTEVLENKYGANWDGSPLIPDDVVRPDGASITQAKVTGYDVGTTVSNQPASPGFTGRRIQSSLAGVGADSSSGSPITFMRAISWPSTIASCNEYVDKKWYDYVTFESYASACGNDLECVYQTALDPYVGLNKPYLRVWDDYMRPMRKQLDQVGPASQTVPRNAFFGVSPREVLMASTRWSQPAHQADIAALLAATDGVAPVVVDRAQRFAWHQQRHAAWAPLELTLDEQDDIARRLEAYGALAAEYDRLRVELVSGAFMSSGGSFGFADALTLYSSGSSSALDQAQRAAALGIVTDQMADLLLAEWRHTSPRDGTLDRGCLGASIACDWSPRQFVAEYGALWQEEREADMARCIRLAGPFAAIPLATAWHPPGSHPDRPPVAAGKQDVWAFDYWLDYQQANLDGMASGLPWKPGNTPTSQNTHRTLRWGITPIHEEYGQPHLLYARYDQAAFVELGVDAKQEGQETQVCAITGALYAKLYAEVHWIDSSGPHSPVLIDAELAAGIERNAPVDETDQPISESRTAGSVVFDARAHFKVVDTWIFNPPPITLYAGAPPWKGPNGSHTFTFQRSQQFSILGIPAYAKIVVQGTPAYESSVSIPNFSTGCVVGGGVQPVSHAVQANLLGKLDVDAKGFLALGVPGLSVGIKGHIEVLRAWVPAMARLGFTAQGTTVNLTFETTGELHARLLGGSISIFAELLWKSAEHELYRWDGIPVDTTLWEMRKDIPFLYLDELFPKP